MAFHQLRGECSSTAHWGSGGLVLWSCVRATFSSSSSLDLLFLSSSILSSSFCVSFSKVPGRRSGRAALSWLVPPSNSGKWRSLAKSPWLIWMDGYILKLYHNLCNYWLQSYLFNSENSLDYAMLGSVANSCNQVEMYDEELKEGSRGQEAEGGFRISK